MNQATLFYQGKYDELLKELEKIKDPSMQETHNLSIVRFLATGESPLQSLQEISAQITAQSPNEAWPQHPSWNLIYYHIGLYHFSVGNYSECSKILEKLWENMDRVDRFIMLCTSLLTIELYIRCGDSKNISQAESFIQNHFSNQEAIQSILSAKVSNENFVQSFTSSVLLAPLRSKVARTSHMPLEESRPIFEDVIKSIQISQDSKNRTLFPVKKIIPIAFAALCIEDARYINILESADDQNHFSILNNRGINELNHKRYSSALLHFSKALDARYNASIVHPFQQVTYNIGLSLLMNHDPYRAFKYFYAIIPLMSNSPFLWLRLTECCVQFYKQRVQELRKKYQYSPVIAKRYNTTTRSFYILPQTDYKIFNKYPLKGEEKFIKDLNLEFAEKCATNAISICTSLSAKANPNSSLVSTLNCVKRNSQLLSSYIALELGDGKKATEMGKIVSSMPNIDEQRQFLAKIYSAQGHSAMGEASEARGILSRLMIESNKVVRGPESNVVFSTTFALVYMAQDTKKAQDHLKKAQSPTGNNIPEITLAQVIIELKNKKPQLAISALNDYKKDNKMF